MKTELEFGPYLKRLRESQQMSLREVAKRTGVSSGYLSQIEGGKRGRRKGGEMFAPHPQILQKLASVYRVDAYDIYERAGYLKDSSYRGFPKEQELDRCFDFVLHDPALKQVLTPQDKLAVCQRYEQETGRKVLTWTPPPTALQKKSRYQGLRLEGDRLYADPVEMALTVSEVAEELNISEEDVLKLVDGKHFPAHLSKEGGQPTFSRSQLYGFQSHIHSWGIKLLKNTTAENLPKTNAAVAEAGRTILKTAEEESLNEARAKLGTLKRHHT